MIKAVYRTGLFFLHWFSFYYVKAQHNLSSHFKDTVTVTQNETTINTAANSRLSKEHVKKKTKVILYFHYGWDDFSQLWWTRQEQQNFYKAIKDYNIAAIFTGHNNATGYIKWNGIDVYSAGSPQSGARTGSFLYVSAQKDSLYVVKRRMNKWGNHSYKKALH